MRELLHTRRSTVIVSLMLAVILFPMSIDRIGKDFRRFRQDSGGKLDIFRCGPLNMVEFSGPCKEFVGFGTGTCNQDFVRFFVLPVGKLLWVPQRNGKENAAWEIVEKLGVVVAVEHQQADSEIFDDVDEQFAKPVVGHLNVGAVQQLGDLPPKLSAFVIFWQQTGS